MGLIFCTHLTYSYACLSNLHRVLALVCEVMLAYPTRAEYLKFYSHVYHHDHKRLEYCYRLKIMRIFSGLRFAQLESKGHTFYEVFAQTKSVILKHVCPN